MQKSRFGNSKKNKVFFLIGAVLIGIALWQLFEIGMDGKRESDIYGKLGKAAVDTQADEGTEALEETEKEDEAEFDYRKIRIDFDALKKVNEEIVGWILFDNNGISYPIVQGADNEVYLSKMADGTKNPAGSIFLDALCGADFLDAHTIVYGHNMKNLSMFGKLRNYRLEEGYYEENRFFTIYTPKRTLRYEIFAWYEVAEEDAVYQVAFADAEAFGTFVSQMVERSYRDTGVGVGKEDKVVTLSTCSREGMRLVVHGKLVAVHGFS